MSRRRRRAIRSLLQIAKEFIKILFCYLRQWNILGVILADVEAGDEGENFRKGAHYSTLLF